jgi:predicted transcriptional regulator
VRELPDEDQDALAIVLLSMADAERPVTELDDKTRAAIGEGLAQARRGEFASDQEIEALWRRHGL